MDKSIKVSVIVPVYNVEQWLEECLESLVHQTLKEIEIIVVNDGSPDNSQRIIERYEKEYPDMVKGFIKENGGLSDARNYGIARANGEFLAFVDSDDYVDRTIYEKLYNKAIEEQSDVVVCGYYIQNESDNSFLSRQKGNMSYYNSAAIDNKKLLSINAPYAWNKLVRKSLIDKTGFLFPKGLNYEDIPTMYPYIAAANNVSKVDEELYFYRFLRPDSITGTFNAKRLVIFKSLRLLNERFMQMNLFEEFRDELLIINLRHTFYRFREFGKYKDVQAQTDAVNEAFDMLDSFFPDWRDNYGSYTGFNGILKQDKISLSEYQSRDYWIKLVKMPLRKTDDILSSIGDKNRQNQWPARTYMKYRSKPIDSNAVLIESFHGKNISDSPLEIMKELLKRGNYKIFVVSNWDQWDKNQEFLRNNNYDVTMVKLGSLEYIKAVATCKYLVNNVSFPIYFYRRKEQIYLNTWHGTPLKTLGKRMKKGIKSMYNIQHNFLQCSHILFPNEFTRDCMMEDYNLTQLYTNKVVLAGYPRNTVFSNPEQALITKKILGNEGKTVYVYMPTWRGSSSIGSTDSLNINAILEKIDSQLDDEHILYVNLHPNTKDEIDYDSYKHIYAFPKDIDKYEVLNSSDALITDYSSVFFDYSITKKPIVLFMYDYDEYLNDRGMYLDVKDLPFTKIYGIEELCDLIGSGKILDCTYRSDEQYINKFIPYDSIDETKKIVDCVFENKNVQGLIVEDYSANCEKAWKIKIVPGGMIKKEDFDQFMEDYDPSDTILVIRNIHFNSKMNDWFYDEYNDKTVYVIYKFCRLLDPRQDKMYRSNLHKENRFSRRRRKKLFNIARERSYERTLPGLAITNPRWYRLII